MRAFLLRYALRNGTRGELTVIERSSCAAIVQALDTFGEALRSCSARPLAR